MQTLKIVGCIGGMLMPAVSTAIAFSAMAEIINVSWKWPALVALVAWTVGYATGVPAGEARAQMLRRLTETST